MDKTLVYESGNNGGCGCSPLEAVALGNGGFGGMNAMLPAMMMGGCGGGFGGGYNSPLWAIIILAFLRNGGLWGDNNGNHSCTTNQLAEIQNTLNTNQGNQLIMSAIQGNATSIKELASLIGCNQNALTTAINGVQSAICNVGNQLGMSTAQIVNSINTGNVSSVAEFFNTLTHELNHFVEHVMDALGIEGGGEDEAYFTGELYEMLYRNAAEDVLPCL